MTNNERHRSSVELEIEEARLTGALELNLSYRGLTELPNSLWELTELVSLNLSNNKLSEIPKAICKLTALQNLVCMQNSLQHLPDTISQLKLLKHLNLGGNKFGQIPKELRNLSSLNELLLWDNNLTDIPDWLGELSTLILLNLQTNKMSKLPNALSLLKNLEEIWLGGSLNGDVDELLEHHITSYRSNNPFQELPSVLKEMKQLKRIYLGGCSLKTIPNWIGDLQSLTHLEVNYNHIFDIPPSIANLEKLETLELQGNPLSPELSAAYKQGLDSVKDYLRAKAADRSALNEAKLIIIGEGEVGKSCLLDALRNEPWKKRNSTHGIEIKPVPVTHQDESGVDTKITLNTWDFGGQKVYRPTHQFFFSAPAIYLVIWKPREGPQQGAIEYWINTIKNRAGPDAKILIVGTHGGPQQRQPDIDLQDLRDKFGAQCVLGSFHVNSRPQNYDQENKTWIGERQGISELKETIANVAAALPNVGREVATSWHNILKNIKRRSEKEPYITYRQFEALCSRQKVKKSLAKTYAGMLNQLGYVIHYGSDNDLKEIMILKPDWLAKAISFVLDDQTTRERNGLVNHQHLSDLWSNPPYDYEAGYPAELHSLFRRLMERFDISYQVIVDPTSSQTTATSLIPQLIDDQSKELPNWQVEPQEGDEEKRQVCQIVERNKNQSSNAEGLFYRLIARLHKYSLGRESYADSIHWQRGLLLDDGHNGRALLRHIGNDIDITVRAAYPDFFLFELTKDVQDLVENPEQGWAGLRCDVMVPCIAPCGINKPGKGMFEVGKLKRSKQKGRPDFPCDISECDQWQNIDHLLQNATVTRKSKLSDGDVEQFKGAFKELLDEKDKKDLMRMRVLYRKMSQADEQLAILMQMSLDEARNGPSLFSLIPADSGFLDNPKWVTQKFQLILWCEHSRKPLLTLNEDENIGSYLLEQPREWLVKFGPALRVLTKTLSVILPVVAATAKFAIPDETYKGIEKNLDFGKELFSSVLVGSDVLTGGSGDDRISEMEHGEGMNAQNAMLRELHAFLKERDPSFGGLVRVQNQRGEFLWVHKQFEEEY